MIECATVRDIERELARLGAEAAAPGQSVLRTRVMTHMAWVPPAWERAARGVLDNLGDRHPSRTIMFLPDPGADRDELDAEVDLRCFAYGGAERSVCSEVIIVWLRGRCSSAPASVAQPLLVSDLPVFLRWRGPLPFDEPELDGLVGVADRLVVDSREWEDLEESYRALPALFDRIGVSDIAWARIEPWRRALAGLWPGVRKAGVLRVHGPRAEALLLIGWLRARLGRDLALEHEPAPDVELVEAGPRSAIPERLEPRSPVDLLFDQLEIVGSDPIYEEAVLRAAS